MSTDRLELLETLLQREKEKRDAALMEWRDAQRQEAAARQQAESLVAYRSEYQQRWASQFAQRSAIEILRCYQGFSERLEQAIATQQTAIDQASTRVQVTLARLQHREVKMATVKRLIERRVQASAQRESRREQKSVDEAAQRLGWARAMAMAAA